MWVFNQYTLHFSLPFKLAGLSCLSKNTYCAPTGTINAFAGTHVPHTWLLCNGQAVSRVLYWKLFHIIGTTYGSGDGMTTFNVPDLRNKFLYGVGVESLGTMGGSGTITPAGTIGETQLSVAQLAAHTHVINVTNPPHTHTMNSQVTGITVDPVTTGITINDGATASSTTGITVVDGKHEHALSLASRFATNGAAPNNIINTGGTPATSTYNGVTDTASSNISLMDPGHTHPITGLSIDDPGHSHAVTDPGHIHSINETETDISATSESTGDGMGHTHNFTGTETSILPPYVRVNYIIKI